MRPKSHAPVNTGDPLPPAVFISLVLLISFSGPIHAQSTQCSTNISQLPAVAELGGFQLGMTKEQVKLRVPQVKFGETDEIGVSKTTINPFFDPAINKTPFQGMRSISLDFLDDRLTSLWIGYDSTFKANTVEEFIKMISQSLHLPDSWRPWRSRGQQMGCADFQLTVTMVADGPSFRILDTRADDVVAQRREEKEEGITSTAETPKETDEIIADKKIKVYYSAGCHPLKEIAAEDRLVFKSPEEAESAGFKPAKSCAH